MQMMNSKVMMIVSSGKRKRKKIWEEYMGKINYACTFVSFKKI